MFIIWVTATGFVGFVGFVQADGGYMIVAVVMWLYIAHVDRRSRIPNGSDRTESGES
jgi:hypothetical protein